MWWCGRCFLWVSAYFCAWPFCGFAIHSSLISGSLHLIHYQSAPLPYAQRKTIRLLFPEHWVNISREGYLWEVANFLCLQTLLAITYTVFICMDLYEPIIYIQQYYSFLSVQWQKKKKRKKKTGRWLRKISRHCYSDQTRAAFSPSFLYFPPHKGGRGICWVLNPISSQKLYAASLDRQVSNFWERMGSITLAGLQPFHIR